MPEIAKVLLLVCSIFIVSLSIVLAEEPVKRWTVYYDDQAALENFEPFSLVVFDSDSHPPLQGLLESGKIVLGYLNLGEVDQRSYASVKCKRKGFY